MMNRLRVLRAERNLSQAELRINCKSRAKR